MSVSVGVAATKLSYFADRKLGISAPIQGESSDILNVEEGKNDYDWLIFISFLYFIVLVEYHFSFIYRFRRPYCRHQILFSLIMFTAPFIPVPLSLDETFAS